MRAQEFIRENFADGNSMSTKDMIAYLRQHHDTNLHQDYLDHLNTFGKFVLKNIPTNTLKTQLSGLDPAKVERYKQMDFSKAPPIVTGDGYILDGYHRAVAAKELGIPTIRAYVGIKGQQDIAEGSESYPEVLYHGSTQEIEGPLTPRQASDIGGAKKSNKNAIYATDDPNFAIAYSLAERGSDTGTFGWKKDPHLIFFGGKIRHGQNVYIHILPTRDEQGRPLFVRGAADAEWYSRPGVKEITPTEVEPLPVDQYLHLLRKPTPEEQKIFQANKAKAKQGVEEGYRRKLNFDEIYGKYLKVTDNNGDPGKPGFSLVTPLNGDSWNWRERPEFIPVVKKKLNQPGWLGDHKYQQIVDAMSGKQFDPAKHIAKENFADGRVKGKSRPGRVKRSGASCNGSVTDLRARAKRASGEKAKMYHWCANMKSGRKK
jgi:hypothetical protein